MSSKSNTIFQKSVHMDESSRANESQNANGISLYNTSSFEDMTMTIKHASETSPKSSVRQLKRPEEMKKFKATYGDSEMK